MELPHLRYAVAAAEHRSFRRAATALNITQPTLSKRIRELEGRLGVLLFERSSTGANPTAIGEEFIAAARRLLSDLEAMENRARAGQSGDIGRLEIGFYTSLSASALGDTIFGFSCQNAQVDINVTEDDRSLLIPLLDRGLIDIAVVLGEPTYSDFAHMSLWSERIMVALPKAHTLSERDFVYWTDLKNERFVLSSRDPGPEIQDILLTKLTSPGDRPQIRQLKIHQSQVLSVVEGEQGITLTCESSTSPVLQKIVFREVRDGNGPTRLGFVAYWRSNNDNPALRQFLAFLQTHPAVPQCRARESA